MKKKLFEWVTSNNVIQTGKNFVTKSGDIYEYETDLRECFTSYLLGYKTAEYILDLLEEQGVNLNSFDCFVGVPETGTILANFLNIVKFERTEKDFKINMIRAVEKKYQESTNSVKTVLPLNEQLNVLLVEDDVVTGNTLLNVLNNLKNTNINIIECVSIIDREVKRDDSKLLSDIIKEEYGTYYRSLIKNTDIKKYIKEI